MPRRLYYFLRQFTDPYVLLMLLMGVGLVFGPRPQNRGRRTRRFVLVAWLALYVLSLRAVAFQLQNTLESRFTTDPTALKDIDAIIVLGAGVELVNDDGSESRLTISGTDRCLEARRQYLSRGHLPLILCGGIVDPNRRGPTEAQAMGDFLRSLNIPNDDLILEERSRSTYENLWHAADVISERKFDRVGCVTSASHMFRATLICEKLGLNVVALPTRLQPTLAAVKPYEHGLPSIGALDKSRHAIHEWLGIAWYRFKGRL